MGIEAAARGRKSGSSRSPGSRIAPSRRAAPFTGSMDTAPPPAAVDDSLGSRLARLRRGRRLSLRGVANRLRRDHSLVLRWEQGRREPTLHDLAALARVFEVTIDDLVRDVYLTGERTWSSRAHAVAQRRLVGSRLQSARERHCLSVWDVYGRLWRSRSQRHDSQTRGESGSRSRCQHREAEGLVWYMALAP